MHQQFGFPKAVLGLFQVFPEAADVVVLHPALVCGADAFVVAFADLGHKFGLQIVHALLPHSQLVQRPPQSHFGLVFQLGAVIKHLLQLKFEHERFLRAG